MCKILYYNYKLLIIDILLKKIKYKHNCDAIILNIYQNNIENKNYKK